MKRLPIRRASHAPGRPVGSRWSWTRVEAAFSLGFILCLVLFPLVFSPWDNSLMHPNSCFRLCPKGTYQRKTGFLLRKMYIQMSKRILDNFREFTGPLSSRLTEGFTSKHPKTFTVSQIPPHIRQYIIASYFFRTLTSLFPFQWKMSTWLITFRNSNILIASWTVHNWLVKKWKFSPQSKLQFSNACPG